MSEVRAHYPISFFLNILIIYLYNYLCYTMYSLVFDIYVYIVCNCITIHIQYILYRVMQPDGNRFCGDVALDSVNTASRNNNSISDPINKKHFNYSFFFQSEMRKCTCNAVLYFGYTFSSITWNKKIFATKKWIYFPLTIWMKVFSSSLNTTITLSKTTSQQILFQSDCITLSYLSLI